MIDANNTKRRWSLLGQDQYFCENRYKISAVATRGAIIGPRAQH